MNDPIVGIDLGTTNSAVAVLKDGVPKIIRIDDCPTIPSCVGLSPGGDLVVGQVALNQLVAAPESTVISIKRKMGTNQTTSLGGKTYSPEEISSFILRALKGHAEAHLGMPVKKAVITVPAHFDESQRKATTHAAELAGLQVLRIINEPTAAALAYDASGHGNEKMLVYDLGGGTFDVSLVVVEEGVVEVKASHGDTHLGGDDFDQCLIDYVSTTFKEQHGIDLTGDLRAMRRLKVVMERAKRTLTDEPFVRIKEDYLAEGKHLELEIARHEYEAMIDPYLQKTLTCIHEALNDAQLVPGQLDRILLVGGASRTPAVARLIETQLGMEPRFEVDPDLTVALGAGTQAGVLAGETVQSILVDITPHTFSTASVEFTETGRRQVCVPLIRRNSPLPTSKSDVFCTLNDGQEAVEVDVYQGESSNPVENTLVGDFTVKGLSDVPAGNPIILKFALDLNGMLKVTATEKATGLSREVVMDTREQGRHFDMDRARENIRALVGEDMDAEEALEPVAVLNGHILEINGEVHTEELLATAKDLRKRSDILRNRGVDPDDDSEIVNLLERSGEAIRNQDWESLRMANDSLGDIVFYLED